MDDCKNLSRATRECTSNVPLFPRTRQMLSGKVRGTTTYPQSSRPLCAALKPPALSADIYLYFPAQNLTHGASEPDSGNGAYGAARLSMARPMLTMLSA